MFLIVKSVHASLALVSVAGFLWRVGLRLQDNPRLQQKWVRVAPHVIDTLLLGCGIALAVQIQQYPFIDGWVTAKVMALVGYILLGMMALKWARQPQAIVGAALAAVATFGYLIAVAVTKTALPGF